MCPPVQKLDGEMVPVETNARAQPVNGVSNGQARPAPPQPHNPYAPRYSDFLSNVSNFKIIESTLRGSSGFFLVDLILNDDN